MQTIKLMRQTIVALMATVLLAINAHALELASALSGATAVDTRIMSQVLDADDKPLDSRSYTIDWSRAVQLNTKKIIGTLFLVR